MRMKYDVDDDVADGSGSMFLSLHLFPKIFEAGKLVSSFSHYRVL